MTRRSGKAPVLSNLVVMLTGLVVAFLLAEGVLRQADRSGWISLWQERRTARQDSIWMMSDHPGLFYTHRPDYHSKGVKYTERNGLLRSDDVSEQAAPGVFRIAVLGDSVAAAVKLAYPDRFTTLLENRLNDVYTRGSVEVLNFGVNGYSSLQEAVLLDALVDRFSPDMLVLQYCMNDFYPSERPYDWFVDHSPLYTVDFLTSLVEQYQALGYPPADYWETLYQQDETGWLNIVSAFSAIARYAEKHEIPVLLAIFPLVSREGWLAGDALERHERVAALGEQAGFDVLDLLPVFAEYDIESIRFKPWDTFHPNVLGHRIAAEALAGWFQGHGYP